MDIFDFEIGWVEVGAAWGTGLSTIHAGHRLYEAYRDRRRICVKATMSSSNSHLENAVEIHNISAVPIIITHWQLFQQKGWTLSPKIEISSAGLDSNSFQIPPYDYRALPLDDQDQHTISNAFGTMKKRGDIYLKFQRAGKRRSETHLICRR